MRHMIWLIFIAVLVSSGCALPVSPVALPLPPRPILPAISSSEFVTLEAHEGWFAVERETVIKILTRDAMRRAYEEELEAVIKSTH